MRKLIKITGLVMVALSVTGYHAFSIAVKVLPAQFYQVPQALDLAAEPEQGVVKISRSFAVNAADKVTLNNQYGTLNVKTWNKNEVRLDVVVYGSPELDASQLSDMISLNAVKKEGTVLLETRVLGDKRKNGKKIRVEFQVYMPESNALTLSHQYGNVKLGDFSGSVTARVRYGNFTAGDLKGTHNDLSISYGSTVIGNLNSAKISQEYGSGLTIGTVGNLSLVSGYAAVKISTISGKATITQRYGPGLSLGTVGELDLKAAYASVQIGTIRMSGKLFNQYSDLNIGVANELDVTAQYSQVKIGRLNKESKLNVQYNTLGIDEVGAGCESLIVTCDHVKTNVGFSSNYHGSLDATTYYSSLKYGPRISGRLEERDQEKRFTGKIGAGGDSKVKLIFRYGTATVN